MKVPLEREPFAPITLTTDQENQLKWLSETMVDTTIAQYEEFTNKHNRVLQKDQWKPVISREDVTIYRRAGKGDLGGHTPKISLADPTSKPTSEYWRVPTALGVGTMAGELDDMLYGLLAMTKTETDVRTTYIKDEAPDSRVLATVIKPTKEDPLQALVLRWTLIYQTLHKIGVTTPRDLVYLESVGSRILPSGERVGYAVMQSLDVPGCGELKDLGIVRCKFSTCYLLRDTGNGSVELYMRSYLEPGGRMGDRLGVFLACNSLIAIWRVMLCGQYKKLAWMHRRASRLRPRSETFSGRRGGSCPICEKSLSGLRSPLQCDICLSVVCSRCSDKRKLTHVVSARQIKRVVTCVCRTCISLASKTSASDVAINEYVPAVRDSASSTSETRSVSSARSSSTAKTPSRKVTLVEKSVSVSSPAPTQCEASLNELPRDSYDDGSSYTVAAWDSASTASTSGVDDEASTSMDQQQVQLWIRMNQLRLAAEEVYMITQQNETVMLETTTTTRDEGPVRPRRATIDELE